MAISTFYPAADFLLENGTMFFLFYPKEEEEDQAVGSKSTTFFLSIGRNRRGCCDIPFLIS